MPLEQWMIQQLMGLGAVGLVILLLYYSGSKVATWFKPLAEKVITAHMDLVVQLTEESKHRERLEKERLENEQSRLRNEAKQNELLEKLTESQNVGFREVNEGHKAIISRLDRK